MTDSNSLTAIGATPRSVAAARIACASGCSLDTSRPAAAASTSLSLTPAAAVMPTTRGLPSVSVPVLSTTSVSTFSIDLERFRITYQHAHLRAATDADHDRHRRRQAKRARTRDDQHANRNDQRVDVARLGPDGNPDNGGNHRDQHHGRHEPAGDDIRESLDRRARATRFGHHLNDLRQQCIGADALGAHHEAAGLVDRGARHLCARFLGYRQRLAGHHRFVDVRAAFEHDAVDRHFLARPHAQPITDMHLIKRDFALLTVGFDTQRRRAARAAAARAPPTTFAIARATRAPVRGSPSVVMIAAASKYSGTAPFIVNRSGQRLRKQQREHTEAVGRRDAERDQREHVRRSDG